MGVSTTNVGVQRFQSPEYSLTGSPAAAIGKGHSDRRRRATERRGLVRTSRRRRHYPLIKARIGNESLQVGSIWCVTSVSRWRGMHEVAREHKS